MAESRPLAPRLMAAMAQQDCGQCGYNCADYANALFLKKEERLNLCAPGGKETLRALKKLAEEFDAAPAEAKPAAPAAVSDAPAVAGATAAGHSREEPVGRHLPVAPPAQCAALRERDLARRDRPCRERRSAMRSATASACLRPIIRSSSIR